MEQGGGERAKRIEWNNVSSVVDVDVDVDGCSIFAKFNLRLKKTQNICESLYRPQLKRITS